MAVTLFSAGSMYATTGTLSELLGKTGQAVTQRLQNWNADDLLNAPVDDVVEELIELATVHCPELTSEEDRYLLDPTEVKQQYRDWGETRTRQVTRFILVVPFEGDEEVFTLRPEQFSTVPPQVLSLDQGELRLVVDDPPADPAAVRSSFDAQISEIERHLGWSRRQIDLHNQHMRSEVAGMVARRREQLLATRNLQADIGYRVRRRPDADTYSAPIRRKTVRPQRKPSSGARKQFKPEPVMEDQDYRAALEVLRSQRNMLERSPSLAAELKEEQIRDLLLVGLNAQFMGDAGGELFNGEGKTDILIRVDDRNIFIGECKVWSGPKTMDEGLDQLFRYLVWRDTKAAILLFIRRKDVTAVIEKAIAKIEDHPYWKRSKPRQADDEQFEFAMHAQDDTEREIHLTLVPFALRTVPQAEAASLD